MTQDLAGKATRSIRLSEAEVDMLLNRLDNEPQGRKSERRAHARFPYRLRACSIRLQSAGSSTPMPFLAPTRNISAGGMSFLHGSFVHNDTDIYIQLITQHGTWNDVAGKVCGCRYLEQSVHEVCVEFTDEIRPSDYCAAALSHRILLAEDDDSIARLALHHLDVLNAQVDRAENGEEAVALALKSSYDCIIMDIEMPIMDGIEATETLRKKGYAGMIVAFTARTTAEDRQRCLEAGANTYIPKPGTPATFAKIIDSLKQESLVSAFQDDASMRDLIIDFVESLPKQVGNLETLFKADDAANLELDARALKGQAGGFGFDSISTVANKLEAGAREKIENTDLKSRLDDLVNLCLRARAPAKGG